VRVCAVSSWTGGLLHPVELQVERAVEAVRNGGLGSLRPANRRRICSGRSRSPSRSDRSGVHGPERSTSAESPSNLASRWYSARFCSDTRSRNARNSCNFDMLCDIVDPLGQKDEEDPEDGGGDHRRWRPTRLPGMTAYPTRNVNR